MDKELFKTIRYYLGMTQRQFAKHTGISTATVALIEVGDRGITDGIQSKIAYVFDVGNPDFIEYLERRRKLLDY